MCLQQVFTWFCFVLLLPQAWKGEIRGWWQHQLEWHRKSPSSVAGRWWGLLPLPRWGPGTAPSLPCVPLGNLLRRGKAAGLWSFGGWDGDLCLWFQMLVLGACVLAHRLCWEVIHWGQYIPIYVCIYVDVHRAHILKKRRFWKASSSPGRSRINWCQEGSSACVLTQVLPVWSGAHVYTVVIHMCVFSSLLFPHISLYSFVSSS